VSELRLDEADIGAALEHTSRAGMTSMQ
jgi:hypothetical protein